MATVSQHHTDSRDHEDHCLPWSPGPGCPKPARPETTVMQSLVQSAQPPGLPICTEWGPTASTGSLTDGGNPTGHSGSGVARAAQARRLSLGTGADVASISWERETGVPGVPGPGPSVSGLRHVCSTPESQGQLSTRSRFSAPQLRDTEAGWKAAEGVAKDGPSRMRPPGPP